eukprot:snap_masked-scaffold252_size238019-processed-gene-1.5 protein:Tk06206 transcript:snap_masked-scaffold252_size238019-processed-gene-1.5-mRNA-1 annotation:"dna polymerase alpha catalytic"
MNNIGMEYNICFTTVSRKKIKAEVNQDGETKHMPDEFVPDLPPTSADPGVLPIEIKKLVDSRRAVKLLLKDQNLSPEQRMQYDIRQMALKLTANSMYGCLGFSFSRFFAKPLAALITSRGREILMQTKHLVERLNLEVIYGDTDSIMINTNSIDYDEVLKLGGKIKQEVNKMYKLLELDVDGVYRYMLLLKKKKYAAVTMERRRDGQVVTNTELKGLDIVRRDWSQLAADAGKMILNRILSDISADDRVSYIHEKLELLADDLREGRIPLSSLAITKQLTKNPTDYADKKALPHVQVAIRLNSKGGKKLKAGDTVEYVICDDGSNLPATQRAYHLDEVSERTDLKVDIHYYLANQLHPVVSRLCDPLDGTDASRIAQSLGLNPDEYRRSNVREKTEDVDADLDHDKYRQCQKLEIVCPQCQEKVTLDGPDRLVSKVWVPFLLECPMPKCKHPLFLQLGRIKNKVTLLVREHIKKFYLGVVTCEDPACSGRTRQLPLRFNCAYPLCPTCNKGGNMYKEYTDKELYVQLEYLLSLFDLSQSRVKDMKSSPEMTKCFESYFILKLHVESIIQNNQYSLVNLRTMYQAFSSLKPSNEVEQAKDQSRNAGDPNEAAQNGMVIQEISNAIEVSMHEEFGPMHIHELRLDLDVHRLERGLDSPQKGVKELDEDHFIVGYETHELEGREDQRLHQVPSLRFEGNHRRKAFPFQFDVIELIEDESHAHHEHPCLLIGLGRRHFQAQYHTILLMLHHLRVAN